MSFDLKTKAPRYRFRFSRIPGLSGLSESDARAVEQVLIEHYGMGKNGGRLQNKYNSIAPANQCYRAALKRGRGLLHQRGYPGF